MVRSQARIATGNAERYAQQMCKHFGHKTEAHYADGKGSVRLSNGACLLTAGADGLTLEVEAEDEERLAATETTVARHIERFAWREAPTIAWSRP
ncbi:DUF2218 domain-containing protein [Propylenella binzhouense]|uniref:DUF2218 domain-containing protein n=1 Tax=Propylenella binzhouense TaxID=2555902 RepID=A0A964T7R2_9HYPH|nr:DUF2218 domain-containing protein [Propylenella binzhouense]MYZ48912.1 DUF2218 domain-containing protein [Propylenella binzhouense]